MSYGTKPAHQGTTAGRPQPAAATGYILIGIALEERDLIKSLGGTYTAYQARVPALIPRPSLRRQSPGS